MNWSDKSKTSDLFFCTNIECRVITFRHGPIRENECPKCHELGALVRNATLLDKGIRSESPKQSPIGDAA